MFLSDRDILEAMESGDIKIDPFNKKNLQPASIDVVLGDGFLVLDCYDEEGGIIRFDEKPIYQKRKGNLILPSGQFALGTTLEYITLSPRVVANVQGRSSIGRRGLFVQNAGWTDPGFEGNLTLEFYNGNSLPIEIKPGMRIGQLTFGYTKTPSGHPYHGKYSKQKGTTGSRSYQDK
ncbi:MAG: dCTP deaminase [Candidatus Nanoarchaeia archaeon]